MCWSNYVIDFKIKLLIHSDEELCFNTFSTMWVVNLILRAKINENYTEVLHTDNIL